MVWSWANMCLGTFGDDQEVQRITREEPNLAREETRENIKDYTGPDCLGWHGGLSAAWLMDCPGQGEGLSASQKPKKRQTKNSFVATET